MKPDPLMTPMQRELELKRAQHRRWLRRERRRYLLSLLRTDPGLALAVFAHPILTRLQQKASARIERQHNDAFEQAARQVQDKQTVANPKRRDVLKGETAQDWKRS